MAQINKPTDYFNTKLYTGNATVRSITGVGFQPDWTWIKRRSGADNHYLFDGVRGVLKFLQSNNADAEITRASSLTSFDSDGFSLGTHNDVNASGQTFASWSWLGGNTTASNTDGSITSTVSANTTSGFSIVSYTGTGSNATIGHGLGAECKMVIIKNRTDAVDWTVNHQPLCASLGDYTRYLTLNATSAVSGAGNVRFQNTAFTSSVFNVGTDNTTNGSGDNIIAYCFAEKKGFSKFGSYTGNGSTDGTFVYTGMRPAFVIQKNASAVQGWQLQDNKRLGYNPNNYLLQPHDSAAESALQRIDLLSNGFKVRTTDAGQNASGNTYIYMAFAESPLVGTNNIPAVAR